MKSRARVCEVDNEIQSVALEDADPIRPMRGIVNGLILGAAFWALCLIIYGVAKAIDSGNWSW